MLPTTSARWQRLATTLFFVVVATTGSDAALANPPAGEPPVSGIGYETTPRMVDFIPPGTLVDAQPDGWTHLIGKSYPRIALGDVQHVNDLTSRLASFIFTCIIARVDAVNEQGQTHYQLSRVGLGLGIQHQGREMIVSPDSQAKVAPHLGFLEKTVLARVHEKQQQGRVMARSRTMALIDTPAVMLRGDRHRWVVLRYAIMVDSRSGRLVTLLWLIDMDQKTGEYRGPSSPIEWLPPNKIDDCQLHVDVREFTVGVPSDMAFAIVRLPPGVQQFSFPDEIQAIAGLQQLTPQQGELLERRLSIIFAHAEALEAQQARSQ